MRSCCVAGETMGRLLTVTGVALGLFAFHASEAFAQCGGGGGGVSLPPLPPDRSSRQTSASPATSYYSPGTIDTRISWEEAARRIRLYGTTSDPDVCALAVRNRYAADATANSSTVKCGGLTITSLELTTIVISGRPTIVTLGRDEPLRETVLQELERKGDKPHKTSLDAKALDLLVISGASRSSKQGDR